MIFYTADSHFGHRNILRFCDRPYETIEEMDRDLIARWNGKVTGNDTVYVLGDMFFRSENPAEILSRLKGKKHLIVGNHDSSWMSKVDLEKHFLSVSLMMDLSGGKTGVTLCHYPLLTWKHAKRTYMIHGHIHKDTTFEIWPMIASNSHILNAGVDINNFEPVTFEELLQNNTKFKKEWQMGKDRE